QTALEFGQIFTPPRSVSLWDVIAAAWGAAAGVVAWWMAGGAVRTAFDRWGAARSRRGVAGWLVLAYSAFVVFYKIVPADITVNVASLQAKWERGMYRPVPFTSLGHDPIAAAFGLAAEALLWLPPAALLALGRGTRPVMAWAFTLLFAVGVETLQLTVQSRVSDSTDVLCAATGAAAGAMLAYRIRPDRSQEGDG
ncbi:MAG TPA: VanZ family protein, partial [Candidatus Eisenbacteria bacterium]|nr:VanZ family protein [Candidatus Eisenbacteria bacterium]